jgi:hypothetical protein
VTVLRLERSPAHLFGSEEVIERRREEPLLESIVAVFLIFDRDFVRSVRGPS